VGGGGTVLWTSNGGENWTAALVGTNRDLHAVAFLPDGSAGIAVGQQFIGRTLDGGQSWENITPEPGNNAPDFQDVALVGNTVLVVGDGNTVLRSDDFGDSFEDLSF